MPEALVDYLNSAVQIQAVQDGSKSEVLVSEPADEVREESTVYVPSRCLQKVDKASKKKLFDTADDLQLLMPILVQCPGGTQKLMNVLVDTGAQVNLIPEGRIASEFLEPAAEPVRLPAANNQSIRGGDMVVPLTMSFTQLCREEWQDKLRHFSGIFYQAAT